MRPIDKGTVPLLPCGTPKTVSDYKNWRRDLVQRLGNHCCFCNMTLNESLQVEHVVAQDIDDSRALSWENLLLACGACNRSKSNRPCPPNTHYLPEVHNTHSAFSVRIGANARQGHAPAAFVAWRGTPTLQSKAENTIKLCALDRDTSSNPQQISDLRWKFRYEAWESANLWKREWDDWGREFASNFIPLLMTAARSSGFWSVWFDVFFDAPLIRRALVRGFSGTAAACFDPGDFMPIGRNPGDAADAT